MTDIDLPQAPAWIVTTSGERPAADVAAELVERGFVDCEVLGEIGVITGRCAAAGVDEMRAIRGVADISPSTDFDIGPPGSPRTW